MESARDPIGMPLNLAGAGTPLYLKANDESQIILDIRIRLHHERRLADFLLPIAVCEYRSALFLQIILFVYIWFRSGRWVRWGWQWAFTFFSRFSDSSPSNSNLFPRTSGAISLRDYNTKVFLAALY